MAQAQARRMPQRRRAVSIGAARRQRAAQRRVLRRAAANKRARRVEEDFAMAWPRELNSTLTPAADSSSSSPSPPPLAVSSSLIESLSCVISLAARSGDVVEVAMMLDTRVFEPLRRRARGGGHSACSRSFASRSAGWVLQCRRRRSRGSLRHTPGQSPFRAEKLGTIRSLGRRSRWSCASRAYPAGCLAIGHRTPFSRMQRRQSLIAALSIPFSPFGRLVRGDTDDGPRYIPDLFGRRWSCATSAARPSLGEHGSFGAVLRWPFRRLVFGDQLPHARE